ncbi:hypothetical protein GCM10023195_56170 [Actinoallomurus liliacearum]|uniref:Uncharacterized protein n=1 Tax=Actinoallomurus liliacearum TaxID=1080073 RepID=A0ABP8TT74_9ACTN
MVEVAAEAGTAGENRADAAASPMAADPAAAAGLRRPNGIEKDMTRCLSGR